MIPAFLEIDCEPDESSLEVGARPWTGFAAMVEFIDGLRAPLAERSGVEPHSTWLLRMDPAIEHCFGRSDFVVQQHGSSVDRLTASGDQFGIHVHPHRWDRGYVYTDHSDPRWAAHCVHAAADAFERAFGERPRRSSVARFIPEPVVDALVEAGVQVDFSVEPGLAPIEDDRGFGDHVTGASTDFRGFPRHPYRVSQRGLSLTATSPEDARALVEIPRTTYDYRTARARFRSRIKTKVLGRGSPGAMHLWDGILEPKTFWDLIARAADESPIPYVALALRSDVPSRPSNQIARDVLTALVQHPLANRIAFVDPLVFAGLPAGPPGKNGPHIAAVTNLTRPSR